MSEWKKRERELNAKAKRALRGTLVHMSLVPVEVTLKDGSKTIRLMGNTYRRQDK